MRVGLLLLVVLAVGCSETKNQNPVPQQVTLDSQDYTLVSPGRRNPDGTSDVPLYQKKGDTNRWYTPSLTGTHMIPMK
jgi:hypothetical protein